MLKNQVVSRKNHRVRKPFRTWRRERAKRVGLIARPAERGGEARADFGRCCDEWLLSCRNGVRESTYIKYNTTVEKHIKPELGGYTAEMIDTALIDGFTAHLLGGRGLAVKTVRDILAVLRRIIEYSAESHCPDIRKVRINYPKENHREMRVLSRDEQERFVNYLLSDTDLGKFGTLLLLFSGIRIGELCALRWKNIDLCERTIRISETLQRLRDTDPASEARTKISVGAPKSDTSVRIIPLTEQAAALCARFASENEDDYVLTGSKSCMEPRLLQYRIGKYTRECGLEGVHAHTLRHTFATRAAEVGFEIKTLSELLGHSTTKITLERYVHSSVELKRSNMEKLKSAGF